MTNTDTLLHEAGNHAVLLNGSAYHSFHVGLFKEALAARGLQVIAWRPIAEAPGDGRQFLFDAPDMECGYSIGYFERGALMLALDGKPVGPHATKPAHFAMIEPPSLCMIVED